MVKDLPRENLKKKLCILLREIDKAIEQINEEKVDCLNNYKRSVENIM